LQKLNPQKDTASDSMIMFLALNTASITLIPMTIIAVRASLNSSNPAEIIGTTIFSSGIATLTAVITVKIISTFQGGLAGLGSTLRRSLRGIFIFLAVVLAITVFMVSGMASRVSGFLPHDFFKNGILFVSKWAIPFLLFVIPMLAFTKKIQVYEVFVDGAKEGFDVAIKIIPYLVAILFAIGMFRASGAMDFFVKILSPVTTLIGMPAEILPAALMRPLSGSGALGIITELIKAHGPDSFIGRLASTIYGCTETTFYVIAVYFGAVQVKKTRYAIPAGLIADAAGVLAAVFICRIIFL